MGLLLFSGEYKERQTQKEKKKKKHMWTCDVVAGVLEHCKCMCVCVCVCVNL
jgi:hypothetical protein